MKDILLDENNDLLIKDGDFVIGESDNEHIKSILIANKGEWKEFPELGVGMEELLNDDAYNQFLIDAKNNLEYDGMLVKNVGFTDEGTLNIDAKYKTNG